MSFQLRYLGLQALSNRQKKYIFANSQQERNLITILDDEYRSFSSSLYNFLHSPVTSSLLGPHILLYIVFSNTLSLRSSLNVSDQVSDPYKTTEKIIVL
jgi:hypothetical protein